MPSKLTSPVRLCKEVPQKLVSVLLLTTLKRMLPLQVSCSLGDFSVRIWPKLIEKYVEDGVPNVLCPERARKIWKNKTWRKRSSSAAPHISLQVLCMQLQGWVRQTQLCNILSAMSPAPVLAISWPGSICSEKRAGLW